MSGLKRKLKIETLEEATTYIEELLKRVDDVENNVKTLYHKFNVISRGVGASINDVNSNLSNVSRKITQNRKV